MRRRAATQHPRGRRGGSDRPGRVLRAAPLTCAIGIADTIEASTLMDAVVCARKRMEVVQAVRKLRRGRDGGA